MNEQPGVTAEIKLTVDIDPYDLGIDLADPTYATDVLRDLRDELLAVAHQYTDRATCEIVAARWPGLLAPGRAHDAAV